MSRFYQPWQREDDESLAGDRRSGPRHGKRDSMQPVENQEDPETSPWNVKRMGVPRLSHLFD
ncbi:hypothetical protein T11_16636 [Trichinella zimbabwensis]|uniref:Uncharacterized protein n=1 Tax=Trichinella zimbabwensis TaxID=268475 RepID=A0A0V1I7D7_9BILA|nr:hypothetical protein T11_16636 [Trichinella zimbabwensis]